MLLAIDPGARTGWALFAGTGLYRCGKTTPSYYGELATYKAKQAIIEKPTIYPHSKADPNNIATLAMKVGDLAGLLRRAGCHVDLVEPRTWKGQVPKPIHHARILNALEPAELALASGASGDTLDAIGLGLWKVGRL